MSFSPMNPLSSFRNVMASYQENCQSFDHIKAIDYEKPRGGKSDYMKRPSVLTPTTSDFSCDVEIAAKRCLNSGELAYWLHYYKSCQVVVSVLPRDADDIQQEQHIASFPEKQQNAVRSLDSRVRAKMGSRFLEVGICPVTVYMQPKDTHGRRLKTIRRTNVVPIEQDCTIPRMWACEEPDSNVICIQACAQFSTVYYTPQEAADILKVSRDFIINKFQNVPGVLNLGGSESRFKRRYRVLRIPSDVLERFMVESQVA
jgi:hypothetical protein